MSADTCRQLVALNIINHCVKLLSDVQVQDIFPTLLRNFSKNLASIRDEFMEFNHFVSHQRRAVLQVARVLAQLASRLDQENSTKLIRFIESHWEVDGYGSILISLVFTLKSKLPQTLFLRAYSKLKTCLEARIDQVIDEGVNLSVIELVIAMFDQPSPIPASLNDNQMREIITLFACIPRFESINPQCLEVIFDTISNC